MANYNSDFTGLQIDAAVEKALAVLNPTTLEDLGLDPEEYSSVENLDAEFLLKLSVTINSGTIKDLSFLGYLQTIIKN